MNALRSAFYRIILLAFCTATFLSMGCLRSKGALKGSVFQTRDTLYHVGRLPDWKRMSLRGADLAYVNESNGSTLFINSLCSEKTDAPLLALTYHLLIGMTEQEIIEQKAVKIAQREGLETIATAKLDGVLRKFKIFVLKKNGCIYDVVLSAPPDKFQTDVAAFDNVLENFDVPGDIS